MKMIKKAPYFVLIFLTSCNYFSQSNQPVARVNDRIIFESDIDSIMLINERNNQMLALNSIIESERHQIDSNKLNSCTKKTEITAKSYIPEYDFFIPTHQLNYRDIIDLNSYDIVIEDANNTLVILFNYDCPFCNMYDAEIRAISEKYKLNLKYIYVTDYVSKKALLCDAAKKQNKFWEVHDLIINHNLIDFSELLKLTYLLELDTIKLKKDLENPEIIKSHLKNSNAIINMGFETVPTYIIKNFVFHDPKSIELVLQKERKI